MPVYDPKKAAVFNQLRQQGISEDAAISQAGISDAEISNYSIGMNGQLGAFIMLPTSAAERANASLNQGLQAVDYDQAPSGNPAQQPSSKPTSYTTTSTKEVSGGGSTTIVTGEDQPTTASRALQPAIDAKQAEIEQFNRDNPSNFARKKLGLPPLTSEENQKRSEQALALSQQKVELTSQQASAMTPGTPTVITEPNTTTTTTTVTTGKTSVNTPVQAPDGPNPSVNQQTDLALGTTIGITNIDSGTVAGEDPYENARFESIALSDIPPAEIVLTPDEQAAADDPYEQRRLELEQQANRDELALQATELEPGEDPYETARIEAGVRFDSGVKEYDIEVLRDQDPYEAFRLENEARLDNQAREFDAESADGSNLEGAIFNSQQQQAISTQSGANQNTDWRVRLRLAPAADYLYNANQPGILAPLATRGGTDGIIFPYTPKIDTGYRAQYNNVDLVHSNYRGYFYQNSYVDAINITGHFTAQNTTDARYLLAVIHFFRSVTKMFYGNDPQRGSPPPLVFLSGYGTYQFNDHPCVVTSFAYNLPDDVDYIKADVANQQGQNTTSRQPKSSGDPQFTSTGGRLSTSNLTQGAVPNRPFGNNGQVNLADGAPTMVPTKMDIQISLLPIVSRTKVSKQFSLEQYASGNGLKGGFW